MRLVGVKEISRVCNIERAWIAELVHRGMPRESRGKYDLSKVIHWYIRYLQQEVKRRSANVADDAGPGSALRSERLRLMKEQADRLAFDNKVKRGELIPLHLAEENIDYIFTTFRERLLNVVDRLGPELEGENRDTIKLRLKEESHTLLTAIAGQFQNGNGTNRPLPEAGSSAPAQSLNHAA